VTRRARAVAATNGDELQVKDLQPDPANRRLHTKRNLEMLVESLRTVKPARSIVIDEDNVVLAGNGVAEAAAMAGISKVRVVEADGSELVAVRRRGLSEDEKRQLAMFDNRASEFSSWDPDQLKEDVRHHLDLTPWFTPLELRRLLKAAQTAEATVQETQTSTVADRFWISVRGPLAHQAVLLKRLRDAAKDLADVEIELGTVQEMPPEGWTVPT